MDRRPPTRANGPGPPRDRYHIPLIIPMIDKMFFPILSLRPTLLRLNISVKTRRLMGFSAVVVTIVEQFVVTVVGMSNTSSTSHTNLLPLYQDEERGAPFNHGSSLYRTCFCFICCKLTYNRKLLTHDCSQMFTRLSLKMLLFCDEMLFSQQGRRRSRVLVPLRKEITSSSDQRHLLNDRTQPF